MRHAARVKVPRNFRPTTPYSLELLDCKRRLENRHLYSRRQMQRHPSALKFLNSLFKPGKELPAILQETDRTSPLRKEADDISKEMFGTESLKQLGEDMIDVMRKAPGVGLAAPQIGLSLKIIVLEDKEAYMTTQTEALREQLQRRAFDPIIICNPTLKAVGQKGFRYWEGCLSVAGYQGLVDRYITVELSGFDVNGQPIRFQATGWQARILQHESDHLHGTLYIDRALSGSVVKSKPSDASKFQMGPCTCSHELQ